MTILNRDDLKAIVVPSLTQVLSLIFVSIAALAVSNAEKLLGPLAKYMPSADIQSGLTVMLHKVGGLATANTAVLVLFWVVVGLAVYGICWAIFNSLTHAYNEAVIDTHFANRGTWLEQLSPKLLQAFFGLAAIGLIVASGWVIGTLSQNFATTLNSWQISHLPTEALQVVLLSLDLYLCWVLVRITFYVE